MLYQYTCPNCKTVLKRQQPVGEGKKIKCPKCEKVFAPPSANKSGGKSANEEDDINPYAVVNEAEDDKAMTELKQRAAMGLIQDRFKKTNRGPAIGIVVRPASYLLGSGVMTGVLGVACFMMGVFPLAFSDFYKKPSTNPKLSEEQRIQNAAKTWDEMRERSLYLIPTSFVVFALGSVVCVGAFKFRALESYVWSWIGAIAALIAAFGNGGGVFYLVYYLAKKLFVDTMGLDSTFAMVVGGAPGLVALAFTLAAGVWSIKCLTNATVKKAFEEERVSEI